MEIGALVQLLDCAAPLSIYVCVRGERSAIRAIQFVQFACLTKITTFLTTLFCIVLSSFNIDASTIIIYNILLLLPCILPKNLPLLINQLEELLLFFFIDGF